MLVSIILLALITLLYFLTRSILITVLGGLALYLLSRILSPQITMLMNKLYPRPELRVMLETEMDDPVPGRGMRALIVTQSLAFSKKESTRRLFAEMFDTAAAAWKDKSEIFRLRFDTVERERLPRKILTAVCGEKDAGMRRCYYEWQAQIRAKDFGTACKEERELFFYDGAMPFEPGGEAQSYAVVFLFDSRLPTQE